MSKLDDLADHVSGWRIWSVVASVISGGVILVSFLIPSLQDQYDRFRSRQVVQGYVRVGKALLKERKYLLAEEAFARAFELSNNQRLDIDLLRLRAKVDQVNEDGEWGEPLPGNLKEVDFIYLLNLSREADDPEQLSVAHSSYALFLAGRRRIDEAQAHLEQALIINPQNYDARVDLGNVWMEKREFIKAREQWLKAIAIDPSQYVAYYNLGILEREHGSKVAAEKYLHDANERRSTKTSGSAQANPKE